MGKVSGFLVVAVVLALAVPAQANIAVEFAGTINPLDFSGGAGSDTATMSVVRAFFSAPLESRNLGDFLCYEGDLRDLKTEKVVGVGVDCLWIAPIDDTTSGNTVAGQPPFGAIQNTADLSPAIDAVTFFFYPGGYYVADGNTTVRPFFRGVGNGDGFTHITGSVPGATDYVVAGTGKFSKFPGNAKVRLSGAVDLSQFFSIINPFQIRFTCLFITDNGKPGKGQI